MSPVELMPTAFAAGGSHAPPIARDYSRQSALVPPLTTPIDVVGVGAVGRQVALLLASMGARTIRIIDFDDVDASNVTTQGYLTTDIGRPKVQALTDSIIAIDPTIELRQVRQRWSPAMELRPIVFACADSMDTRRRIHGATRDGQLVVDGRVLGETVQVYPYCDDATRASYAGTLFADADAEPGRCTAKMTVYSAAFCAAAMAAQFARYSRGKEIFASRGLVGELLVVPNWGVV